MKATPEERERLAKWCDRKAIASGIMEKAGVGHPGRWDDYGTNFQAIAAILREPDLVAEIAARDAEIEALKRNLSHAYKRVGETMAGDALGTDAG